LGKGGYAAKVQMRCYSKNRGFSTEACQGGHFGEKKIKSAFVALTLDGERGNPWGVGPVTSSGARMGAGIKLR